MVPLNGTSSTDQVEIFIDHNHKRFMLLMDSLRDQEVPTHFSTEQERVNLCKDLVTFGPFKGIKGASTLQDPGCARGLGAGIDLNYGNSSSSSKMNSESDGEGSRQ
jgi:hypothetical protein